MVRSNRTIANLASAIDSGTTNEFLGLGDSGVLFEPVAYADISNKPTILDSAATIALFDSAYIANRQSGGGIDSAKMANLIDSAYVQARTAGGGLDSAKMTNLIDSAYITARVTSGLDSAGVTGLVDSSYVTDRFAANSGFDWYLYTATAGQTVFDSIDDNGETLSYNEDGILVFYNGILMLKTYDYTATDGTSITLTTAADSGANVAVVKYGIGSSAAAQGIWYGDTAVASQASTVTSGAGGNVLSYYSIPTTGNAQDFGDLDHSAYRLCACADGTRAYFIGENAPSTLFNTIQYVTISSPGNSTDFGDMAQQARSSPAAVCDTIYAVAGGGLSDDISPTGPLDTLNYFSTGTSGNASSFGTMTRTGIYWAAFNDATYGVFAGGAANGGVTNYNNNVIDYITIQTPGNGTDFGDLTVGRAFIDAGGNSTRMIISAGYTGSYSNVMDYVSPATPGNATDFGDTSENKYETKCASNATRLTSMGGQGQNSGTLNVIEYVTIDTTGNTTDFGDLTSTSYGGCAAAG
jgi:hypothetical protein